MTDRIDPQLPLPLEPIETRDSAYRSAIESAGLPGAAGRLAAWLLEGRCEMVDGCRARVVDRRPLRKLAAQVGLSLSSCSRGLAWLRAAGLLAESSREWGLNLTGVVERSGATGQTAELRFVSGPAAGGSARDGPAEIPDVPARSTLFQGVPGCSSAFQAVPARSTAFHCVPLRDPDKEINTYPEILPDPKILPDPDTDPECAPAKSEPAAAAELPGPSSVCEPLGSGQLTDRRRRINASRPWRELQSSDFAAAVPLEKLRPCFRELVRMGLIDGSRDSRLHFLATAHDCQASARSPAGALVWRAAAGQWNLAGQSSYDWAKQVLRAADPHQVT